MLVYVIRGLGLWCLTIFQLYHGGHVIRKDYYNCNKDRQMLYGKCFHIMENHFPTMKL